MTKSRAENSPNTAPTNQNSTSFDRSLPMMLNRALDVVMPPYRDLFSKFDITEQQWRVLRVLWSSERATSVELSNRTLLSPPSLVGILDRLEKKQLISRLRSTTDRRAVYIVATASGKALGTETLPLVEAIQQRMQDTLSADEWTRLELTLIKISQQQDSTRAVVRA